LYFVNFVTMQASVWKFFFHVICCRVSINIKFIFNFKESAAPVDKKDIETKTKKLLVSCHS